MFENNGKNVSGNVVKVKSQQNIKSLYNFVISLPSETVNSL